MQGQAYERAVVVSRGERPIRVPIAYPGAFNVLNCKINAEDRRKSFVFNPLGFDCLNI
jgi:hypothetical protein